MSDRRSEVDCQTIEALIPAYSLGATDWEETALVESQLADCPEAQAAQAGYRALADAMLFSAPPTQPPAVLAERLKAATAPPASRPQASPVQSRRRWRDLLAGWQLRPAYLVALVALVVLVAANLYWIDQLGRTRADHAALADRLTTQDEFLLSMSEVAPARVALGPGPSGQASGAYAVMVCNPASQVGFIFAEKLPSLEPGTGYQLWLRHNGERISGGMLALDGQGNGSIVFRAPRPVGDYEMVGITAEPAGGSASPTSPAVIQGSIYGAAYQDF